MDYAVVTVAQMTSLKVFDMDADQIGGQTAGLSRLIEKYAEEEK